MRSPPWPTHPEGSSAADAADAADVADFAAAREELALFKARLVAVVLEFPQGFPVSTLRRRYRQVWGAELPPPAAFGCRRLLQMLERVAGDVARVERRDSGEVALFPVGITRAHIAARARLEDGGAGRFPPSAGDSAGDRARLCADPAARPA